MAAAPRIRPGPSAALPVSLGGPSLSVRTRRRGKPGDARLTLRRDMLQKLQNHPPHPPPPVACLRRLTNPTDDCGGIIVPQDGRAGFRAASILPALCSGENSGAAMKRFLLSAVVVVGVVLCILRVRVRVLLVRAEKRRLV